VTETDGETRTGQATHHHGEALKSLHGRLVLQEAHASHDGYLQVDARQEVWYGADLVEPVGACVLGVLAYLRFMNVREGEQDW
jgi:hypothetical protein